MLLIWFLCFMVLFFLVATLTVANIVVYMFLSAFRLDAGVVVCFGLNGASVFSSRTPRSWTWSSPSLFSW